MRDREIDQAIINQFKEEAEALGITLQEYLTLLILEKLDNLSVTAYIENQ